MLFERKVSNVKILTWDDYTFGAGLGARRVGPGDAEAILDGGGRARGSDMLLYFMNL